LTAMEITKNVVEEPEKRCKELLDRVGIDSETAKRNVRKISGGEQQRIAIARALGKGADIILADEPTGNLDEETAAEIMELFLRIAHEDDKCVILVTHSKQLASRADVVVHIKKNSAKDRV
ncbi:MAG: ATP-binding cassette domain-containing protein, partial [Hespellia sp.]|nr:ATP-binding cassette domain-containing protein [Hespellia sp.]